MRVLFLPGLSTSTLFVMAGLARASQLAGHEVLVAGTDDVCSAAAGIGLPAVPVTGMDIAGAHPRRDGERCEPPQDADGRSQYLGRMYGRLALASTGGLHELAAGWRPDVVVAVPLVLAAPLLAEELGVPFVLHSWGAAGVNREGVGASMELRAELAARGLDAVPAPDHYLEIQPPGLGAAARHSLPTSYARWVPGNPQVPLEPWMYRRGDRPRVCITDGSRATADACGDVVERLVGAVSGLDVEVLVAVPEDLARRVRASCGVRAGWLPLDVIAPTCDVIVHQGGGVTGVTALRAGVPQLFAPRWDVLLGTARRMVDAGAGVLVPPGGTVPETVTAGCATLLGDPGYRERAGGLAAEMAALPPMAEAVHVLERLAAPRPPRLALVSV